MQMLLVLAKLSGAVYCLSVVAALRVVSTTGPRSVDLLGFFEPVIFVRQLGWVELDCAA